MQGIVKNHQPSPWRAVALAVTFLSPVSLAMAQAPASLPFTDLSSCPNAVPAITEAYATGITTGTSPTTFGPALGVSRSQMATFVTRTLDQSIVRESRNAPLNQWATPRGILQMATTTLGGTLMNAVSDGTNVWVADSAGGRVLKVEGSTGRLLETWTGASGAFSMAVAMGKIFIISNTSALYEIDPQGVAGPVTVVTTSAPILSGPTSIVFDGTRLWIIGYPGVSFVTPRASLPWHLTTVTTGFQALTGGIYDGSNIWVTDFKAGKLFELDSNGAIVRTVAVGATPMYPVFDGTNIFVPRFSDNAVSVVRAATGVQLPDLTGNGLAGPEAASFDGRRILITNFAGDSVSVWKAANLKAIGTSSTGVDSFPTSACSDGLNFWVTLQSGTLVRF